MALGSTACTFTSRNRSRLAFQGSFTAVRRASSLPSLNRDAQHNDSASVSLVSSRVVVSIVQGKNLSSACRSDCRRIHLLTRESSFSRVSLPECSVSPDTSGSSCGLSCLSTLIDVPSVADAEVNMEVDIQASLPRSCKANALMCIEQSFAILETSSHWENGEESTPT